jgi:hypothetical protein
MSDSEGFKNVVAKAPGGWFDVELGDGKHALADDTPIVRDVLMRYQFEWSSSASGPGFAVSVIRTGAFVWLHRLVLGIPPRRGVVAAIVGSDTLDCRSANVHFVPSNIRAPHHAKTPQRVDSLERDGGRSTGHVGITQMRDGRGHDGRGCGARVRWTGVDGVERHADFPNSGGPGTEAEKAAMHCASPWIIAAAVTYRNARLADVEEERRVALMSPQPAPAAGRVIPLAEKRDGGVSSPEKAMICRDTEHAKDEEHPAVPHYDDEMGALAEAITRRNAGHTKDATQSTTKPPAIPIADRIAGKRSAGASPNPVVMQTGSAVVGTSSSAKPSQTPVIDTLVKIGLLPGLPVGAEIPAAPAPRASGVPHPHVAPATLGTESPAKKVAVATLDDDDWTSVQRDDISAFFTKLGINVKI